MGNNQLNAVARHLDLLEGSRDARELSDGQLLERFAVRGEEAAFAALVRRHGPMVLGLCRRVLRHGPDAEDAFQATFLVLFRRARALDRAGSLANWLYTVAYRAALKARADAARRREREGRTMTQARAQSEEIWSDLQPVLDEELNRLPARYRAAVVVCYLQGKTNSEAARLLGCPTGTVKSRLSRARDLLRARLARRGVALSAGLLAAVLAERAAAAVPRGLVHAAVQTTVLAAAGKALAPAASLAEGVLKAMFVAKVKIAILVLLTLGALFFAAGVWAYQTHPSAERGTGNTEPCDAPRSESRAPGSEDAKKMTVTGRVLDPEGKPVAGAQVTVCVREGMVLSTGQGWASFRNEVLGQVKSDKEGTYRLTVPRANPLMTFCSVRVVAVAANYGLAFKAVEPVAEETEAELRLTTVQRVTGHIVGLQGEDAAGVKIHVGRMKRAPDKGERDDDTYFRPPADLPVSATTDDKGNFVFSGFGPNVTLELEVLDPRYERKTDWTVNTANKKECENIRLLLAPGRYVEGRVVYQDTGKPAAHARLRIFNPIIEVTADADGRFKVPLYTPRDDEPFAFRPRDVTVIAYPPRGEPYQSSSKGVDFPKGVVKREVEFVLPRVGVLRGKVTEAGSGKPVEGAYVAYNGDEEQCVVSGADGSFQIGAPAGGGRLLVVHPSGEYIPQVVGSGGGLNDKAVGEPYYYHAVVDVQVKKDEKVTEANVTLRRGVTVKGRLLGADDKPVDSAVMFVAGGHRPRYENTMHPVLVRAGAFDVRGLDPEKTYRLLFLEHPRLPPNMIVPEAPQNPFQLWMAELLNGKDKRGAIVEVAPKKQGDEPLVVRIAPCGSVKLRFVDGAGKPLAGYSPWVQLVVTPGPPIFKAVEDKTLAAEVITLVGRYGNLQEGEPKTDGEGRVTLQGLIPGATYRIKKHVKLVEDRGEVFKDFSVEAGKTAEVEIVVK